MSDSKLTPGVGFHLKPNGLWVAEEIPEEVLETAKFSGRLDILGYNCETFETPALDQWGQRVAIDLAKIAARLSR